VTAERVSNMKQRAGPVPILFCIDRIARGGTETQVEGLIGRLDRHLFAPHLCTLRPSDALAGAIDCPRLELGARRLFSPAGAARLARLARYLRRERIALVQTFFQDATVLGMAAARLAGVPVRLISFRDLGFWRTPAREFLMRRTYPLATGFLANSEAVKRHVCARDGLPAARVKVIYNGADPERYPFVEHTGDAAAIGIVANLNRPVKRADLFLRAAARVAARHPEASWHLIGEGELRPRYEALAAELGLAGRVVFAGAVGDVGQYLRGLAIGVICSDSEGFSNAVLEYMLSGCAVVATAVGGNLEAVRDRETGLLVPPDDPAALAEALGRLLDDPAARLALARRARVVAEGEFGWERSVADHQEHYGGLLRAAGAL
jgi:L-malate glycosyltransferase